MTKGFIKIFYLLLLPFSFLLLTLGIALSQTTPNYDVTVSPVYFDLSTNPGTTVSDKVRIRNNTSSPLPIRIVIKKLTGDVNGDLTLRDTSSDDSLSWIRFQSPTFVAKPLEWTDVPFSIAVPKEAAYGYYFAISFSQDNSSPLAKTGAKITGAAAVPILLNVRKEGAKISGNLLSFKTDASWYEYLPTKFKVAFSNTGNVHIRPTGNIFIKDFLGRQVGTLSVNSTGGAILPDTRKVFENSWDDSFITEESKLVDGQPVLDKNGKPQKSLRVRWDKITDLRIGKYTATALLVVSANNRDIPYSAQVSFLVFPWKIVAAIVIFILFLIYREIQVRKLRKQLKTLLKENKSK